MPVFLTLGNITFQNFEVPESINFGGDQMLSVKRMVGGKREVQAMGRDDSDITWTGLFQGESANFRASYLDGQRVAGKPLPLFWSMYNYMVVIKNFHADFKRFYWIPYTITCTVVQDLNKPFPVLLPVAYDDAIRNAMTEANDIALLLKNPSISSSIALVGNAVNSVASFTNVTASVITKVSGPLSSAISTVSSSISSLSSSIF